MCVIDITNNKYSIEYLLTLFIDIRFINYLK